MNPNPSKTDAATDRGDRAGQPPAPDTWHPAPDLRADRLALRRWFYPYVGFLAALLAAQGLGVLPVRLSLLSVFFVYMALACTFMPLPTAAPVMYTATVWNPLLVTVLGTVGTGLANLHDYYVLTYLLRRRRIAVVRSKGWYARAEAWFWRAPFATLAAASFLPIPVDVVRLLAISSQYPRLKFALAGVLGRAPRYAMLAYLADRLDLSVQAILLVLAATIILGVTRGLPRLIRQVRAAREGAEV